MVERTQGNSSLEQIEPQLSGDALERIESPGLVFFAEAIRRNIEDTIGLVDNPARLRPHFKTHKTREIARMWLERGVTNHKCATLAEAEVLATAGATDVLIAYQLIGPNIAKLLHLTDRFPAVRFASLVDCLEAAEPLATAFAKTGRSARVFLDLNSGMNRTGAPLNRETIELYEWTATTPGVEAAGLHWYDGHLRQPDLAERRQGVLAGWDQFTRFRDQLVMSGLDVPTVVAGGSGSFNFLAETGEPRLQVSPGTVSLWDASYHRDYDTLGQPAGSGAVDAGCRAQVAGGRLAAGRTRTVSSAP
jgi:D-threonine aldolase